jgi:hypothetical protein
LAGIRFLEGAISSAGRASLLHREGQRFESSIAHHSSGKHIRRLAAQKGAAMSFQDHVLLLAKAIAWFMVAVVSCLANPRGCG